MVSRCSVGALLLLLLPRAAATFELEKGPYLQNGKAREMTVVWETLAVASGSVRYGLGPELAERSAETAPGTHHRVVLEDLQPGAAYFYALYEGDVAQSEIYGFTTDAGPATPFRFILYGDNRTDDVAHERVADAILMEEGVGFIANTGDMVANGQHEAQWTRYFDIENELLARYPVFTCIGNHEEHNGEVPIWDRLFALPDTPGHYYAYTWGNSRFLVLDGHVEIEPWFLCLLQLKPYDGCFNAEQDQWLRDELRRAAEDPAVEHVFVSAHIGPYSSKAGRTGSGQMRDLMDTFLEAGVDLVMTGHDHYYQHGRGGNGLHYVITGGGGAPLYGLNPNPLIQALFPHDPIVSQSIHHYVLIEVDGPLVRVTAKTVDGEILEAFDIRPRPPCEEAADCQDAAPGACEGAWACEVDGCCWICDEVAAPACLQDADCPPDPGADCAGAWRCGLGRCAWICEGGECERDLDCQALAPLNGCPGGHFGCADLVCEWRCPRPGPDGGLPPSGGSSGCGCRGSPSGSGAVSLLLLLGLGLLRRSGEPG